MNSHPFRSSLRSTSTKSTSPVFKVRLQFRYRQDPQFALALNYLEEYGYLLSDVLKELIKVRFTPVALNAEGNLPRSIALECIGKLRGYIYEIEQLAGIETTDVKSHIQPPSVQSDSELIERGDPYGHQDIERATPPASEQLDQLLGFTSI